MALLKMWTSKAILSRCVLQGVTTTSHQHLPAMALHTSPVQSNSNKTAVVRCGRQKYERNFPVLLMQPDGSTIHIRYREPRRIVQMPVDITTLSEEERKRRMKKRDPKKVVKKEEVEFEDDFKVEVYQQFLKKK